MALTPTLSHGERGGLCRSPIGVGEDGCEESGMTVVVVLPRPAPAPWVPGVPGTTRKGVVDSPSPQPSPTGEGFSFRSPIGVGEDETGRGGKCGGRALKQPRGVPGVASVGSVSADPRFYTRLEPWDVFVGKRCSSVSLRTVRQQRRGGGNYPAYTWWLNHGRRRFSALHPQPRLNGVR